MINLDFWQIVNAFFTFVKPFWPIILGLIVLVVLVGLFRRKTQKAQPYKYLYGRKASVMTHTEQEFFRLLTRIIGDRFLVFPQIHLPSIVEHKIKGQSWFGAFRHIDEKSVDYVLCEKNSLHTVLAIELDDPSHERPDRIQRDIEVQRILESANLPLLRIKGREMLDGDLVLKRVNEILAINQK